MPIVEVMFEFGVKPAWAIVRPVVRLAIVPSSEEPMRMISVAPKRSPTSPCDWLNEDWMTLSTAVMKNPV